MATPIKYYPDLKRSPHPPLSTTNTLGILRHTLLPSLPLHTTLSVFAYAAGRYTNRLDSKDLLWPSGLVANAWYHAVVSPYLRSDLSFAQCISYLSYTQKLILGGITIWGVRLFYQVFKRSYTRKQDDPRYAKYRSDPNMWNNAFLKVYLPEAVFQSLISFGWSVALCYSASSVTGADGFELGVTVARVLHGFAVGCFGTGLALEVLADWQLGSKKEEEEEKGGTKSLLRDGVWSVVRHPNYLGDALVHLSFPLLAFADSIFDPLTFVGPLANYAFLRFIGGTKENEESQEQRYIESSPLKYRELQTYKAEKNSFWPKPKEVGNLWTWVVLGLGSAVAVSERLYKNYYGFL